MKSMILLGLLPFAATPALGQSMDHSMHNMPGMTMPAQQASKPPVKKRKPKKTAPKRQVQRPQARHQSQQPARAATVQPGHDKSSLPGTPAPDAHAGHTTPAPATNQPAAPQAQGGAEMQGMDMETMPGMNMPEQPADTHAGHDMSSMEAMPGMEGMEQQVGQEPPPPAPTDHAADRVFDPTVMAGSRAQLRKEHGGSLVGMVLLNVAEYQVRKGKDGYRWDGEAWYGGDVNRLTLKSEGEGAFRDRLESAEIQALYSRALDPYWNLQAGVRYDFKPNPSRTYATVGIEGLAPGFFEVEGALFLSNKGDLLGRLEGYYDQRITQRLILQPRVELNFAAQDVPENRIGSGLSNAELGLRLRYEIRREFAPYIGVSYDRKVGDTARFARIAGEDVGNTSFVAGIRFWF